MDLTPHITDRRRRKILEHVYRNRMTTVRAVHELDFADHGASVNAVSQVLSRLVNQGDLNRHLLYGTSMYYTLGPRSRRLPGVTARRTLPIGEQRLPLEYASLVYTSYGDVKRKRLLPNELRDAFPWFPDMMFTFPWYFDYQDDIRRLAVLRVELAHSPRLIIEKHLRQIERYRTKCAEFGTLVDAGRFIIVTITAAKDLRDALDHLKSHYPSYPQASWFYDLEELQYMIPRTKRNLP